MGRDIRKCYSQNVPHCVGIGYNRATFMAITIGQQLGSYEITALLGKGGMGEVYRARDTKLKREVAIKILPGEFSRDPERAIRFQREAEVLASLNHPHIGAIYDVQHVDEMRFLVLELVEGETLVDRLTRGAIPVEESLKHALQVAEAIDAAHEKGVIHRDLKPANIKITRDGTVKVLDFGLAKAFAGEESNAAKLSDSPTLSLAATQHGIILGTAAYMSPEQARGEHVDKRADIWAFGVVLYEMVTGKRLFEGKTVSDVLAAVLMKEPDLSGAPPKVRSLLHACLDRDPKRRLRDIGEAWPLLDDNEEETNSVRKTHTAVLRWIIAAVSVIVPVVVAMMVWAPWRVEPGRPLVRLDVDLGSDISLPQPEANVLTTVAISPDGTRLAYLASPPG